MSYCLEGSMVVPSIFPYNHFVSSDILSSETGNGSPSTPQMTPPILQEDEHPSPVRSSSGNSLWSWSQLPETWTVTYAWEAFRALCHCLSPDVLAAAAYGLSLIFSLTPWVGHASSSFKYDKTMVQILRGFLRWEREEEYAYIFLLVHDKYLASKYDNENS